MPRESHGGSNVSLRTKSREFAMQMLFQWDMSQQDFNKLEVKFWKSAKAADKTRAFANKLFEGARSEEHTSELQSQSNLVCRLLLEKKKHRRSSDREGHTRRRCDRSAA